MLPTKYSFFTWIFLQVTHTHTHTHTHTEGHTHTQQLTTHALARVPGPLVPDNVYVVGAAPGHGARRVPRGAGLHVPARRRRVRGAGGPRAGAVGEQRRRRQQRRQQSRESAGRPSHAESEVSRSSSKRCMEAPSLLEQSVEKSPPEILTSRAYCAAHWRYSH